MLPFLGRYLLGDYLGLPPMMPERVIYRSATVPQNFGVNENDGFGAASSDYDAEMQRMLEEMRKRNERKREEEAKMHQERMRLLTMGEEEPNEVDLVLLEQTREMEKRQRDEDARAKQESENRLKEMREKEEKEKMEEEKRRKEFEEWKKAEDQRWKTRDDEMKRIHEETREAQNEKLEKIEAENASRLVQSEEESARMKEEFENQLRTEKEQCDQAYEEYCSRWRYQMGHIMMLMKQKEWDMKMERKWTDRLDALRQWLAPIRHSFNNLRLEMDSVTRSGRFHLNAKDRSQIEMTVRILLEKLAVMEKVMEDEVEEMERMAEDHPEASFLNHIEESATEVGESAAEMTKDIEMFVKGMKKRSGMNRWNRCIQSFEHLEQKVALIPTVDGLKEKMMQPDAESEDNSNPSSIISSLQITEME
ncbi:hypothetical protein PMAYCL1PPCAC_06447 [Pristionchus mayeri]|uniref:Uncharacterized protein n=1 Tax=Pristionchus mayeri TaxID=1317129 RepID=A0AAN4ZEG5_9BILA|nr:hypothetical protein PMAYCL1PPCAC_06447 [Pristionchus mayeri]